MQLNVNFSAEHNKKGEGEGSADQQMQSIGWADEGHGMYSLLIAATDMEHGLGAHASDDKLAARHCSIHANGMSIDVHWGRRDSWQLLLLQTFSLLMLIAQQSSSTGFTY